MTTGYAVILRRRRYVLLLALLCTITGLWAVHKRPITYAGCEALYLAGPPSASNTYLDDDPSLAITTGMVTQTMMSQPMQQELRTSKLGASYTVIQTNTGDIRWPSYSLPTLQVCSYARSSQTVLLTVNMVTDKFRSVLYEMQLDQRTRPRSFIVADTFAPAVPYPILGRPSQAYLGVILIGLIGGIGLTLLLDPILRRRADRLTADS